MGAKKKKKKKGTESWNEEGWGPDDQMNFVDLWSHGPVGEMNVNETTLDQYRSETFNQNF